MKLAWRMLFAAIASTMPVRNDLAHAAKAETNSPSTPVSTFSIDQTRYFATPQIEAAERKLRMDDVAALPSDAPDQAPALLGYLHRAENLLAQLERHNAYLHLRASLDIDDRVDAEADEKTSDAIDRVVARVEAALRKIGDAAFATDVAASAPLDRYAYLFVRAQRDLQGALPEEQQAIVDELADPAASNLWTVYQQTVRSTPFAKITSVGGELDTRKDARLLSQNPDRAIREAAWRQRWSAYASRADIYASILLGVVRLNDRVARLQHFQDAPSRVYFKRDLDRKDVTEALAAVESRAEVLKGYQRMRAHHIGRMAAISDVHPWDWSLPAIGFDVPRMTLDQTRAKALEAFEPLGKDYVQQARQLLDPINGRMDIALDQGKRTNGGFSIGAPGVRSGLFVESYGRGLLGDSRVIVHEGGHAIHKELMTQNGVSPFYTRGPNWMFEAFAILNEFLLYDHLYRTSTDAKARAYYLEALIDDMATQLFTSAEEGTLEQSIYDGVVAGRINNAGDLDALSLSIWGRYEIWPASQPEFAHVWTTKSLMYQDPLYLVNYLYAGLLATRMLDMAEHDPATFRKRYADLLRGGFYARPEALLRTFFGHELTQRELVDGGINLMQQRVATLENIYRDIEGKR